MINCNGEDSSYVKAETSSGGAGGGISICIANEYGENQPNVTVAGGNAIYHPFTWGTGKKSGCTGGNGGAGCSKKITIKDGTIMEK